MAHLNGFGFEIERLACWQRPCIRNMKVFDSNTKRPDLMPILTLRLFANDAESSQPQPTRSGSTCEAP